MPTTPSYPLQLEADLDPQLSRGLWLVKWLLIIPHLVVLFVLWIGLGVSTVVSFFAILVTGRFPRPLFNYNLGVLRWSWRVAYYAYGALGTDRYPPFTLQDRPDYPARLDIAYPGQLSRGLVLVKWWLLVLPHALIVAIIGGAGWMTTYGGGDNVWGGGLIGLLALIAGVTLLFTSRYPQSIFNLVVGLNRWVFRVGAYTALMTDVYPPFRLDMGGREPDVDAPAMSSTLVPAV